MLPDIVRPLAGAITAGFFGAGSWLVAQAAALDRPLELVGGGILVTAAVVSLGLILKASKYERSAATKIVDRLEDRVEALEDDLAGERERSARLLLAYDHERQLRVSLEEAGLHDRRHPVDTRPLVRDSDYGDLADEMTGARERPETRDERH